MNTSPDEGLGPDDVVYGDPPGWWYGPHDIYVMDEEIWYNKSL